MDQTILRRELLRGDLAGRRRTVRPPWAVPAFESLCNGCGECLAACPEHLLARDPQGLPRLEFRRGECTFCGDCRDACHRGALAGAGTWKVVVGVADDCLARRGVLCRSCRESCPEGALTFELHPGSTATPRIDLARCNGCGGCVAPCPVDAIRVRNRPLQEDDESHEHFRRDRTGAA